MVKLKLQNSKDSRIKLNKINDYIQALSVYGKQNLTDNYAKHICDEIWELRPIRDRILFATYDGDCYVLLHRFKKNTQKTPLKEIRRAKNEFADFMKRRDLNE
jgi:phage-related protein